jgi:CheY-like chemotaxis protein
MARQSNDAALVLIVDPDQSVRDLAAETLGRAGYLILQVESLPGAQGGAR